MHTQLYPWGEKRYRCYVHLYYNAHAAAEAADSFTEELLAYKEELETGLLIKDHEEAYKTFFSVMKTPALSSKEYFNWEMAHKNRFLT